MRTVKLIGISLVPAILLCGVFWLGGWNFERGGWASYLAVLSILWGVLAVVFAEDRI